MKIGAPFIIIILLTASKLFSQNRIDLNKSGDKQLVEVCEQRIYMMAGCELYTDYKNTLGIMTGTVCYLYEKSDHTWHYLVTVKINNNLLIRLLYSADDRTGKMPTNMVLITGYIYEYGEATENSKVCAWFVKKRLYPKNNILTEEVTIYDKYKLIIEDKAITKFIVIGKGTVILNKNVMDCFTPSD